ncbi:stage II sporulation protein D [Lederbergia wuyishanensis]|uniref:Stage II sporulation protein D n=1 Tax=Lederbergia wuyishanensis TaxID=1347903 RepID=A0ABU0D3E4_9BACI|nr:stage II sporulation protein D [Lederbergia wuyishanensis]MCJ8007933.1 stage II sporulation protein D [Lederbergia wuyishanensis]MDQ0342900.1 stage II sporulation protein D [Lederbergia wuyishanensis]
MKPLKPAFIFASILLALSFTIPAILVLPFTNGKTMGELKEQKEEQPKQAKNESITEVAVFRTSLNKIETLPLEDYVIGVVASEMPADFEKEALKAQALAARTYIVTHLMSTPDKASIPEGADIKDTVDHQVYKNKSELKKQWGKDFDWKYKKVEEAVKETAGEVLTFNDKPITASFFSTSNGFTENAEEYWKNKIPYLKSVKSPWDVKSPKFNSQKVFTISEFEQKLGVSIGNGKDIGTVTSRTEGKKVATVKINGKSFTGREIREKLDLRSTDFNWIRKGDSIIVTTKGFGHGVGMSQYGANGMAKEGKKYDEIVTYYYQGISISKFNNDEIKIASK